MLVTRPSTLSRIWRGALAIGLTLLALGVLIRQIAGSPLANQSLADLDPLALLWPLASTLSAVALSATKWHTLLVAMGQSLPWTRAMRALLVAWPYAAVTPSRAGDLVRAFVIKDQVPLPTGGVSVVVDRLLDVQSLVLLATLGALYQQWWWIAALLMSPIAALWACVFWAKKAPVAPLHAGAGKVARLWHEGKKTVQQLAQNPAGLAKAAALSLCTWLLVQCTFFLLNRAFSSPLTIPESFGLWPLATLIGLAPITLAGMGTRDIAFISLLALSRHQLTLDDLNAQTLETLIATSGHLMLATVAYTALSSWLFAIIGLPWSIREWLTRDATRAET